MFYKLLDKKKGSGVSIKEKLADKLHKQELENSKQYRSMRDLKEIFGQQIQLKLDHRLLRIEMLNI